MSAALQAKKGELEASIAEPVNEKDDLVARVAALSRANESLAAALDEQSRRLAEAAEALQKQLAVEIQRGDVDIVQYRDVLIVNMKDTPGFAPDSPVLRAEFEPVLRKIAETFARFPDRVIRVEGHTAVAPSRWRSSWDLGAARAVAVVRFLQEKAGVEPSRLLAISFGEFRPRASNSSEALRQKNRRVELVLVDRPLYQVQELIESKGK